MSMMGDLAREDSYDPEAVDWSRMNQPFGTLLDPNPVQYRAAGGVEIRPSDIDSAITAALGASGGGLGIKAYHGSPHSFDRFDLSKIGTGEGAQAYGHGLYFAENEGVARSYRDALKWKGSNWDDPQVLAQNALQMMQGDRIKAADQLQRALDSNVKFYRGRTPAAQAAANAKSEQAIALLRGDEPITTAIPKGHMYEVNLNADPAHFLDWDKPLKGQTATEQLKRLQNEWGNSPLSAVDPARGTGADVYNAMKHWSGGPDKASADLLREAGIPGIRYLDQGSRAAVDKPFGLQNAAGQVFDNFATEAAAQKHLQDMIKLRPEIAAQWSVVPRHVSSNYVVFNPSIIDILRKYGIAGAAPLGALAATDNYQPD